ncbi:hypothetical protein J2T56_001134 [Natronobacillus azotifigens]|uniref:Uncharacterized protein n=1 Tax=Natronobacillus azotifigens TaxID=472978 RepID=A0A9J6RC99_9BACI|nr:hypothetical protein [Natronobacillus azotifigens]MCZ0702971.1 hypothetical protein [Natronobacillus azotifigens]
MNEWYILLLVFLPLLFSILNQFFHDKKKVKKIMNMRKKKGVTPMNHEILKKHIGRSCSVSTLDHFAMGTILSVNETWLEVEVVKKKSKQIELINLEYVEKISIGE